MATQNDFENNLNLLAEIAQFGCDYLEAQGNKDPELAKILADAKKVLQVNVARANTAESSVQQPSTFDFSRLVVLPFKDDLKAAKAKQLEQVVAVKVAEFIEGLHKPGFDDDYVSKKRNTY